MQRYMPRSARAGTFFESLSPRWTSKRVRQHPNVNIETAGLEQVQVPKAVFGLREEAEPGRSVGSGFVRKGEIPPGGPALKLLHLLDRKDLEAEIHRAGRAHHTFRAKSPCVTPL